VLLSAGRASDCIVGVLMLWTLVETLQPLVRFVRSRLWSPPGSTPLARKVDAVRRLLAERPDLRSRPGRQRS
jgi:hypothetical protein